MSARNSKMEFLSLEAVHMHNNHRFLFSALFLTAALAIPSAMTATPKHQDNGRQEEHRRDDDHNRVYDRDHKDYHNWDDNENRAWGQFLTENHRESHEYAKSNKKEQSKYWSWRNSHPDHDGR